MIHAQFVYSTQVKISITSKAKFQSKLEYDSMVMASCLFWFIPK